MMLRILVLFLLLVSTLSAAQATDMQTERLLRAAIDAPGRDTSRDRYRHPYETLCFFGLKRDMAVMEVTPGGGWYRAILEPVVAEQGRYVPFNFRSRPDPGSIDMVLTFRNVHNWFPPDQAARVFALFYDTLKPGGILGVVEHRWPEDAPDGPQGRNGYVKESLTVRLAEQAGFELVARSDINANPKDTKDYPRGVWTLPPTLALRGRDRDKYLAIGESDRFTLKFVKPAS